MIVTAAALLLFFFLVAGPDIRLDGDLYAMNRPQALTFMDKDGKRVGVRGAFVGDRLKLSEMPPYLPAAFLAMEDKRFYEHHGFDISGLARAAVADLKAGHIVQGGSTVTQQVVKIVFLSPDRTISRKLQEIAGAWELENKMSKEQILELYLNRIYLGSGAYGVDGAAHVYFGKSARNLTVAEAAMLAALTRAPSAFSPRRDLAAAQERANQVLDEMLESRVVTKQQVAYARMHPATVVDLSEDLARDYFLDAASEEVQRLLPGATGDLTVYTAMDPALQSAARAQIANVMRRGKPVRASQAALVSMTPEGAVRALIGGVDYADSAFNRVTKAHRQPGSAFKVFVYLAALEHGLTPYTVRTDEPITIKNWTPDNYNETHLGPVTLEQAFARSINTVAVQLGAEVGIPNVISVARRLGIESPLDPYASLALGTSEVTPMELTAAYGAFAAGGRRVQPYLVTEIRSPKGEILYHRNDAAPARVVSDNDVLSMNEMMYQVVQWGTGQGAAVPGHEVAGKTGTSAEYRDAWFIGFAPQLVTGVWVGNDDFTPMKRVTGGSLPAQIWSGYMRVALKNMPPTPLPRAAPYQPEMAQADYSNGDNFIAQGLDQLGSFFSDIFGGNSSNPSTTNSAGSNSSNNSTPTTTRRDRTANTGVIPGFFSEASPRTSAGGSGGSNTSSNYGTGSSNSANIAANGPSTNNERSADTSVNPLPEVAPPPVRRDDGQTKNLEDVRRSMADEQRRAAQERYQRDMQRYSREMDRYNREINRYGSGADRDLGRDSDRTDDRSYQLAEPRPMPRRFDPPPNPAYDMPPPSLPRYRPPPPPPPRDFGPGPRDFGPPPDDDRGPPPPDMNGPYGPGQ